MRNKPMPAKQRLRLAQILLDRAAQCEALALELRKSCEEQSKKIGHRKPLKNQRKIQLSTEKSSKPD
jgi:hypothetical protein